jgi:hypothetical protein
MATTDNAPIPYEPPHALDSTKKSNFYISKKVNLMSSYIKKKTPGMCLLVAKLLAIHSDCH